MKKKMFKMKLKIKGENVPVFIDGEEKGVISTQLVEFPEDSNIVEVVVALSEVEDDFIKEHIEVITESVDPNGEG